MVDWVKDVAAIRDDWSRLAPYFTEDAVADLNGTRVRGRDAVVNAFRTAVAMFDRRFDSRRMRLVAGRAAPGQYNFRSCPS